MNSFGELKFPSFVVSWVVRLGCPTEPRLGPGWWTDGLSQCRSLDHPKKKIQFPATNLSSIECFLVHLIKNNRELK